MKTIITKDATLVRLGNSIASCRSVSLRIIEPGREINCTSYWSEGSRSYFAFAKLSDGLPVSSLVPQQSGFDKPIAGIDCVVLPKGVVCLEHEIFCGKDRGVSIYVRADDVNPTMLVGEVELSDNERACLVATRSLKNTYAGETDLRRKSTSMDVETWKSVQMGLIARGLLNKAGAITDAGKNALN